MVRVIEGKIYRSDLKQKLLGVGGREREREREVRVIEGSSY